jgi:acetoin utilization deacetylase AcuC-like enzyme
MGYFNLDGYAFKKIGEKLITLNIPILFIQEGGYNKEANFEAAINLFKNFERR